MSNKDDGLQHDEQTGQMTGVVERNIKTLVERRTKEENEKPIEERIADAVTKFTGNMAFVYTHLIVYGIWIFWNIGWLHFKPFDPTFVGLSLEAQIEAIFLATFVLMSQRSIDSQADKRDDLNLQMNLLSEHEITKLISLVTAIAGKLGVEQAQDAEINELAQDITPEKVMDTLETHKKNILQAEEK